jgi:hypothetical protein
LRNYVDQNEKRETDNTKREGEAPSPGLSLTKNNTRLNKSGGFGLWV